MTNLSETLLIIITIMGLCLLFAWLDSRDAKLELAELKKDKLKVCEIHQYNSSSFSFIFSLLIIFSL